MLLSFTKNCSRASELPECGETVLPSPAVKKEKAGSQTCSRRIKISTTGLSHSYLSPSGTTVTALRDINLTIYDQELVAIVGPSGCGKSTLLNIMSGLISPSAGDVYLDNRRVQGVTRKVGYMSQTDTLMPWRTLMGNVELGLEIQGMPKPERRRIAVNLIEKVGLAGFENSYPHELSGGMKKRAMIIRNVAADSEVLFMDEPFGALDFFTRQKLQDEILKLWQETRKTILFVTHDLGEAITLSDRVILLTGRPSTIRKEFPIPLPRPRSALETRFQPRFLELQKLIWDELREEVMSN